MKIDRQRRTKTVQKTNSFDLIDKIQKFPVVPRVGLYIFTMAIVGTASGAVKYRVEARSCMDMARDVCWLEPTQKKAKELALGAAAGTIAATLISIPALIEDE